MQQFIRKNLIIIAGIVIPLLLFVFLSLSLVLIIKTTAPPKYDFLYLESKGYLRHKVENNKLSILYWNSDTQPPPPPPQVKLIRYHVNSNTTETLKIDLSGPKTNIQNQISQNIFTFSGYTVNTDYKSPDGYSFYTDYGMGYPEKDYQTREYITKNGKIVAIPSENLKIQFVGWIIP